jgi:23S rRNA (cytosine1962-C5)-methyltransferase
MNLNPNPTVELLESPNWSDYELIDSGAGRKLERFGMNKLIRPEAEAVWQPQLPEREWQQAAAEFVPSAEENGGHWVARREKVNPWQIRYQQLNFQLMLSNSKQVGIFPEQACQWDWVSGLIQNAKRDFRVLNLFGYTGGISMAAAAAGAQVTHLDASKKAVQWAKENQALCQLPSTSIRWMLDDGLKFVQREARRGSRYQGIILDPPKFGRGPKGEVWEFYRDFPELIRACEKILADDAEFLLVTAYAIKASSITIGNAVRDALAGRGGNVTQGEVCLREKSGGRLLSMAIFGRWQRG